MRVLAAFAIAVIGAVSAPVACTFGDYDGNLGAWDGSYFSEGGGPSSDGGGPQSATVSPSSETSITSADGFFTVHFPVGSVKSNGTAGVGEGTRQSYPYCGGQTQCWQTQYAVQLSGTALAKPIDVRFDVARAMGSQSGRAVIVDGNNVLPGVSASEQVFGIDSTSSNSPGPYVIALLTDDGGLTTVCQGGTEVCGTCAKSCCNAGRWSPQPSDNVHYACICFGGGQETACLEGCAGSGEMDSCQ